MFEDLFILCLNHFHKNNTHILITIKGDYRQPAVQNLYIILYLVYFKAIPNKKKPNFNIK